jgi:isopentenyl-diphosphate delta-isomerase
MEEIINLVDGRGARIGAIEKIEAHRAGVLHEAFSIFVANGRGEMLLQKRAAGKYHSGGLWSNACCGHPRFGEAVGGAAHRRLREEMGFDCPLRETHHFIYQVEFDNGLTEYEFDRVFVGLYEGEVKPNEDEAEDFRWTDVGTIAADLAARPDRYTYWFRVAFPAARQRIEEELVAAGVTLRERRI